MVSGNSCGPQKWRLPRSLGFLQVELILSIAASQESIMENQAAYFAFMSDNLYSSDAANLGLFDIKVDEMIVYLNREVPADNILLRNFQ